LAKVSNIVIVSFGVRQEVPGERVAYITATAKIAGNSSKLCELEPASNRLGGEPLEPGPGARQGVSSP
jgi:hypothetical protein